MIFSKVTDSICIHIVQDLLRFTGTAFKIHHKNMNSVLNDEFRMNEDILSQLKLFSLICVCVIIDLGTWGDMVQIFNFLLENVWIVFNEMS